MIVSWLQVYYTVIEAFHWTAIKVLCINYLSSNFLEQLNHVKDSHRSTIKYLGWSNNLGSLKNKHNCIKIRKHNYRKIMKDKAYHTDSVNNLCSINQIKVWRNTSK